MEEVDRQVIKRIEEIIRYYNLSVTRLAKRIGMSFASISKVLNYHQKASPSMIDKIRKAFPDVDIQYIVTGAGTLINKSYPEIAEEVKSMFDIYGIFDKVRSHTQDIDRLQKAIKLQQEIIKSQNKVLTEIKKVLTEIKALLTK